MLAGTVAFCNPVQFWPIKAVGLFLALFSVAQLVGEK
jgi:hypothetical protein